MKKSNAITRIRQLFNNRKIWSFLICLSIASLLWVVHALNRNYKYTLHVPVTFLNLPTNKDVVGELPEYIDVDIKTSGTKLLFITLKKSIDQVTIDFNLLKNNAKSQAYSISNGNFNLQNSINLQVEILKIRPDTLFFTSNTGNSRLIPIKANLKINCLPGYTIISKPVISPAYVTVTGENKELNKIDTIYTTFLNLKEVHESSTSIVPIKKPNSAVNLNIKNVQLYFKVDKLIESTIKVPIQIINNTNNKNIKLLSKEITIKYLVAMKDYETINEKSFKAIVNFNQVKEKQKQLTVEIIKSPPEVKIIKLNPNAISYLIYK